MTIKLDDSYDQSVAIIGMACRFPGADTVGQYWQNLQSGTESISRFSDQQLKDRGVKQHWIKHPSYVKAAGVLSDIEDFDAAFFNIPPREAEITDPQQRILMECTQEALEDAAFVAAEERVAVFVGVGPPTYLLHHLFVHPDVQLQFGLYPLIIGNDKDFAATRLSYKFNFRGPSMTVNSACSTSLVAVNRAQQSLLTYECDVAVAGGATVVVPCRTGYFYEPGGVASPDGHCRAFDHQAQGMVGGSGAGVIVLKRLQEALEQGDPIHAILRGSATNNDGSQKVGFTAPSVGGQVEAIADAYANAGVLPETVQYVEAHGTGTSMGDPIEISALNEVFGKQGSCLIGSVKTNIGHLDTASGVAGLIKVACALKHRHIPPSLHFEKPNPEVPFDQGPFQVVQSLQPWPNSTTPPRAAVSSFGIGGSNAHAILEAYTPSETAPSQRRERLFTLSAKSKPALKQRCDQLAEYLENETDLSLADLEYTLHTGREAMGFRLACIAEDRQGLAQTLRRVDVQRLVKTEEQSPFCVFMFPGQGSQYCGMAREIYTTEPEFRRYMSDCAQILQQYLHADIWQIIQDSDARRLEQTAIAQPALFSIEYALARLWNHWGVFPHAMIGHSLGEYVAACLAGVMSLEDALRIVVLRGQWMQQMQPGSMLSVAIAPEHASALLSSGISVAAVNGRQQCVLSGDLHSIAKLEDHCRTEGIGFRKLHTSHGFHSPMMNDAAELLHQLMLETRLSAPRVPFISNTSGDWITADMANSPEYWSRHMCEPVLFSAGVETMLKGRACLFIEVGPGNTLSKLAQKVKGDPTAAIPSLPHAKVNGNDYGHLLQALGEVWCRGLQPDCRILHQDEKRRKLSLPTYPFQRKTYWIDPPEEDAAPSIPMKHDEIDRWFYEQTWFRQSVDGLPACTERSSGPCLICMDGEGLGNKLAHGLREHGRKVITVKKGEKYERLSSCEYVIEPGSAGDYRQLWQSLEQENLAPRIVLHLWTLTPVSEPMVESRVYGFYSLLYLSNAISKGAEQTDLYIISRDVFGVTGTESTNPLSTMLGGVSRVIPQECKNICCTGVDIGNDASLEPVSRYLLREFAVQPSNTWIAYRGGYRWTESHQPLHVHTGASTSRLRDNGVYVITGGLGYVGYTIAMALAEKYHARLALIGRTNLEDDQVKIDKFRQLQSGGDEVIYIQADVTRETAMEKAVRQVRDRFGAIHGVIHAAGNIGMDEFELMQAVSREKSERQFLSKIDGTQVLDHVLQKEKLDFIVLLSSLSTVLGGLGFYAYSAANAFLDGWAYEKHRQQDHRWMVINYDAWTHNDPQGETFSGSMADLAITPEQGAEVFIQTLSAPARSQWIVSTGDLAQRKRQWLGRERNRRRETGYERPEMETEFVQARDGLDKQLAQIWGEVLGFEKIGIDDDFFALGGDSLAGMQMVNKVQELIGGVLHITALFECPTISGLSSYLRQNYTEEVAILMGEAPADKQQTAVVTEKDVELLESLMPKPQTMPIRSRKNPRAVFVLSPPRSGSTLLRVMLAGNTRLFAPPELELLMYDNLAQRKRLSPSIALEGTVQAIVNIKQCSLEQAQAIMETFESDGTDSQEFYAVLQHWVGDKILVDKSPSYSFNLNILQRAEAYFDKPLYIHLLRHPLGMIRSFEQARLDLLQDQKIRDALPSRRQLAELIWLLCQRNIREFLQQISAERRMTLQFERLVKEPEEIMNAVCRFMEVPYHTGMLAPYEDKQQRMTVGLHEDGRMLGDPKFHQHKTIDACTAEQWRQDYSEASLSVMTVDMAEALGYPMAREEKSAPLLHVLNPQHDARRELIMLHPVGGGIFCYKEICSQIRAAQCTAVQYPFLDETEQTFNSLVEMAACYREQIQARRQKGPYFLAGWSMGGALAFEIACQFQASGHCIDRLAMIDSHCPGTAVLDAAQAHLQGLYILGRELGLDERRLRQLNSSHGEEDLLEVLYREVQATGRTAPVALSQLGRRLEIIKHNQQLLNEYRPSHFNGTVHLMVTRSSAENQQAESSADLGWSAHALSVHSRNLPGDHFSIMQQPIVADVAGWLNDLLDTQQVLIPEKVF